MLDYLFTRNKVNKLPPKFFHFLTMNDIGMRVRRTFTHKSLIVKMLDFRCFEFGSHVDLCSICMFVFYNHSFKMTKKTYQKKIASSLSLGAFSLHTYSAAFIFFWMMSILSISPFVVSSKKFQYFTPQAIRIVCVCVPMEEERKRKGYLSVSMLSGISLFRSSFGVQ